MYLKSLSKSLAESLGVSPSYPSVQAHVKLPIALKHMTMSAQGKGVRGNRGGGSLYNLPVQLVAGSLSVFTSYLSIQAQVKLPMVLEQIALPAHRKG